MENTIQNIPDEIKARLNEIAEHLWMEPSSACLMVGAGMSKNAEKTDPASPDALSWYELADKMQEHILGVKDVPFKRQKYANVLNIADQLEAVIKKGEMNRFLEQQIPDKELKPSELHKSLLCLPWRDVFTTNYDTLLERTAEQIVERKYEFVVNKENLVQSHSPRIIKLHGSFPDNGPYIISEEDYRKYPQDNATLVNTVQQALIENTLCLVGFSGDDPNFLKWIGWIRDNLKDNMQPIYLIDHLKLDLSQSLLFEKRNIIPIDLAKIYPDITDYAKALKKVIQYLNQQRSKVNEWGSAYIGLDFKNESVKSLLEKFVQQRENYPGWMVVPYLVREKLTQIVLNLDIDKVAVLDGPDRLSWGYEMIWLYRHALWSLYRQELSPWENLLKQYNPYSKIIENADATYTPESNPEWNWMELGRKWIDIQLYILKTYREHGVEEEWIALNGKLEKLKNKFTPEQLSQYQYELCLHCVYQFDFDGLKLQLNAWNKDAKSVLWRAKYAMLVSELVSLSEGKKELELALLEIRKVQNLNPVRGNYSALSVEAYIICALQKLILAESILSNTIEKKDHTSSEKYTSRTQQLKHYQCDPWGEMRYFEYRIRPYEAIKPQDRPIPSFDLNRTTTNHSWANDQVEKRLALQYWQYLEESGSFFHLPWVNTLPKQATLDALSILRYARPYASYVFQIRYGTKEAVQNVLSRKYLAYKDIMDNAEFVFKKYQEMMDWLARVYKRSDKSVDSFMDCAMCTLPEALSRLCSCVTFEARKKLLGTIATAYALRARFDGMDILVKRLMNSFSLEEQESLLPELIKMPYPVGVRVFEVSKCDPMYYLSLSHLHNRSIKFNSVIVYYWLSMMENESDVRKEAAAGRVQKLYKLGLLTEEQKKCYADLLWKERDEFGFPKDLSYYKFYYTNLPSPEELDPVKLFQSYIDSAPFDPDNGGGVSILNGDVPLWCNILATSDVKKFVWTSQRLSVLTDNIVEWWRKYEKKIYLKDTESMLFSQQGEYQVRLRKLSLIVSEIIYKHWRKLPAESRDRLLFIVEENNRYLNSMLCLSAAVCRTNEQIAVVESKICKKLMSDDESAISDACNAIVILESHNKTMYKSIACLCRCFAYNRSIVGGRLILQTLIELAAHKHNFTKDDVSELETGLSSGMNLVLLKGDAEDEVMTETKLSQQVEYIRLAYYMQANYTKYLTSTKVIGQWIGFSREENFNEIRNVIKDIEWQKRIVD